MTRKLQTVLRVNPGFPSQIESIIVVIVVRYFAQTARQNKQQWKIIRNLKGYASPVLESFNRENDTSFPTREMLQIDLNQVFIMTQSNNHQLQT